MRRPLNPYQTRYYFTEYQSSDVNIITRNHVTLGGILPRFKYVSGDFDCSYCQLTSLEGCPIYVGGWFRCSGNKLTSLKYRPIYTGDLFICDKETLLLATTL